jgi:hypothetical protein
LKDKNNAEDEKQQKTSKQDKNEEDNQKLKED